MEDITLEEDRAPSFAGQTLWITLHTFIALGTWAAVMVVITLMHPQSVPVVITWSLAFIAPFVMGFIFTKVKQDEMAPHTWLIGLIWFLIICLWILDMPTGPNQCYHCDATQKMLLTFFSTTDDSGLIDGQGRFIGTWPATALIAYGIASGFALNKNKK